ncbi:hypothetical protein Vafri_11698 [Volvox africanus]|uniref:LisH domain-containing protein n=1 Tax=Volvox africanus TaxID=51714 RepID=A0A8J4F1Y9_9CHLO|nr:hypothetical protein Vafri_11698 [Volvox africanus]
MGKSESPESGPPALTERGARDLLNHIVEYLQYLQYHQTVQTLLVERGTKRSQLNNSLMSARTQNKDTRERLRAEMMRKFDEGRRDDFFTLWQQYVPASMLGLDFATQKMEFYLQVYFAIYPVLPSSSVLVVTPGGAGPPGSRHSPHSSSSRHELSLRMKSFKSYLEGRGAALALTAEFLPYYALPFVQQPEHHPSFEQLFQSRWVDTERLQLKTFLEGLTARSSVPILYVMYTEHLAAKDGVPRLSPRGRALRASSRAHTQSREVSRGSVGNGGLPPAPHHQAPGNVRGSGANAAAAASVGSSSILEHPGLQRHQPYTNGEGLARRSPYPAPMPGGACQRVSGLGSGASSASASTVGPLERRSGLGHPVLASAAPLRAAPPHGHGGFGYRGMDDDFEEDDIVACLRHDGEGDKGCGGDNYSDESFAQEGEAGFNEATLGQPAAVAAVQRRPRGGHRHGGIQHDGLEEEEFDEPDELEIAEALRSPDNDDLPAVRGFPSSAAPINGPVGLSLEQLGMTEGAVLRENVQLLESTMGNEGAGGGAMATKSVTAEQLVAAGVAAAAAAAAAADAGNDDDVVTCRVSSMTALAPLDYRKVKRDLQGPNMVLAARLLQALRWRLTRSRPGADRWGLIACWIEVDLLDCHTPLIRNLTPAPTQSRPATASTAVMGRASSRPQTAAGAAVQPCSLLMVLTSSSNPGVVEEAVRLANAIASDRLGRNYLMMPGGSAVHALMGVLRRFTYRGRGAEVSSGVCSDGAQPEDGAVTVDRVRDHPAAQQALVTLQKLSLKRVAQSQMVQEGAVEWVVDFLQDLSTVSPTAVEYGTALLMNLCLRSAGRAAATRCAVPLLSLCESLLDCSNDQVHTYVNGTLYSIFSRASIREAALARGTPDLLERVAQSGRPPFAAQCQYILRQLYMPDLSDPEVDASEDDAAPDGDADAEGEEGTDDAYTDVDITPESLAKEQGEPCGEELLCGGGYLASSQAAREHLGAVRCSVAAAAAAMAAAGLPSVRGSVLLGTLPQGARDSDHGPEVEPDARPSSRQKQQRQKQRSEMEGGVASAEMTLSGSMSQALLDASIVGGATTMELGLRESVLKEDGAREEGRGGGAEERENEEGGMAVEEIDEVQGTVLSTVVEGEEGGETVEVVEVLEAVTSTVLRKDNVEKDGGAAESEFDDKEEAEAETEGDAEEEEAITAAVAATTAADAAEGESGDEGVGGTDAGVEAEASGLDASHANDDEENLRNVAADVNTDICPSPVPSSTRYSRTGVLRNPEDMPLVGSKNLALARGSSAGTSRPSSAYVALATSTASTSILAAARALEAVRASGGAASGGTTPVSTRRRSYIKPVTPTALSRGLHPPWGATGIGESGGGDGDGREAVAVATAAAVRSSAGATADEIQRNQQLDGANEVVATASMLSTTAPTQRRKWELSQEEMVPGLAEDVVLRESVALSEHEPMMAATAATVMSSSIASIGRESRAGAPEQAHPRPPTAPRADGSSEATPLGSLTASSAAALTARPPSRQHPPVPPAPRSSVGGSLGGRGSESGSQLTLTGLAAIGTTPTFVPGDGPSAPVQPSGGGPPATLLSARLRRTTSASGLAASTASTAAAAGDAATPSQGGKTSGTALAESGGAFNNSADRRASVTMEGAEGRGPLTRVSGNSHNLGAAAGASAALAVTALETNNNGEGGGGGDGGDGWPWSAASSRPSTAATPLSRPGTSVQGRPDPAAVVETGSGVGVTSPPSLHRARPSSPGPRSRRQSVADNVAPSEPSLMQRQQSTAHSSSNGSGLPPAVQQPQKDFESHSSQPGAAGRVASADGGAPPGAATGAAAAPASRRPDAPTGVHPPANSSSSSARPSVPTASGHAHTHTPAQYQQQPQPAPISRQRSGISPGPEQRGRGIPRPPGQQQQQQPQLQHAEGPTGAVGSGIQGTSYRGAPAPAADTPPSSTTKRSPTPPGRAVHRTRMGPPSSGPQSGATTAAARSVVSASPPRGGAPGAR